MSSCSNQKVPVYNVMRNRIICGISNNEKIISVAKKFSFIALIFSFLSDIAIYLPTSADNIKQYSHTIGVAKKTVLEVPAGHAWWIHWISALDSFFTSQIFVAIFVLGLLVTAIIVLVSSISDFKKKSMLLFLPLFTALAFTPVSNGILRDFGYSMQKIVHLSGPSKVTAQAVDLSILESRGQSTPALRSLLERDLHWMNGHRHELWYGKDFGRWGVDRLLYRVSESLPRSEWVSGAVAYGDHLRVESSEGSVKRLRELVAVDSLPAVVIVFGVMGWWLGRLRERRRVRAAEILGWRA